MRTTRQTVVVQIIVAVLLLSCAGLLPSSDRNALRPNFYMTSTEQWEGIWGHLPLGFGPYQHPAPFDEGDIASLPDWQQELLSDTDWNKPYIPPRDDGESDTQSTP